MPLNKLGRRSLALIFAPALSAASLAAHAGGFALLESSASGLGTSYAGVAAQAEDASTIFYNPAGLTYLPGGQITGSVDLVRPSAKFSDGGSLPSGTNGFGITNTAIVRPLGSNGGDAGSLSAVPALFASFQVAPKWTVGIGINAPFGQKTNYSPDWIGRFQGLTSKIETININPTVAWRVTDRVSLGLGLDYQRIDATFSQGVNYGAQAFAGGLSLGAAPATAAAGAVATVGTQAEGSAVIKGSDYAWGWNGGAIFELNDKAKLGIAYRSEIKYRVNGTVTFNNAPTANPAVVGATAAALFNGGVASGNVHTDVKLPPSVSASLVYQLDPRWTVMGNVAWTGWSSIQNLNFYRDNGALLSGTAENFRDTWRVGLGATYKVDDQWLLRAGTAYDQSPVRDAQITPRLPDQDRYWLSFGAQYKLNKAFVFDVGYAHLFANNRSINQNNGSTTLYGAIIGTYQVSVDILGAQVTYKF